MNNEVIHSQGFMLLKVGLISAYRGVDRQPFEPTILEGEIVSTRIPLREDDPIYKFYPPGWRKDAYRLFAENMVKCSFCELPLLQSANVAERILKLIPKPEGKYEIVSCRVFAAVPQTILLSEKESGLIGYDVIYPGGDYYSAIKNGLHINPHPMLKKKYSSILNRFGLFKDVVQISEFIREFRKYVPSESASKFILAELKETKP